MSKTTIILKTVFAAIGALLLLSGIVLADYNHYIMALVLVLSSVILYFATVFLASDRDFLDLCAVFSLIWLMTIGLSQLRLLEYQEAWIAKTWVCLALGYAAFQMGILAGQCWGVRLTAEKKKEKKKNAKPFPLQFRQNNHRLYLCCVIGTLIGLACFCINIAIRGYVPFFSSSDSAYKDFYTRFHVFATAGTMLSGPCYYCIKSCGLKKSQKALLYLCILYNTFVFPILVVSRGTFIVSAVSLSCALYYLNRKKLWILIASLIVMFAVYAVCSVARNYTEAQLDAFFEPAEITIGVNIEDSANSEDTELSADSEDLALSDDGITFSLPGQAAFLYCYLTVSHDNFNQAVKYSQSCTYGLRQLRPFNVILRSSYIEEALDNAENYLIRSHLTTVNLFGEAYYDFHVAGMILLPLLWGLLFGLMQSAYLATQSPYLLHALGNVVAIVMLCFFSKWMSIFSTWMHWGVALLFFLFSGVTIRKKDEIQEEPTP